jgi:predicted DNA-binding transcriptional regulator AlpA
MSVEQIKAIAETIIAGRIPSPRPPPTPGATERLLTLADCRQAAQVTRWTIWRWINEEGLRVVKIGKVTRVRESDWQAFLCRHIEVKQ